MAAETVVINGCYVEFVVEGNPIPKARPVTKFRGGGRVRTFTPATTAAWESVVAFAANRAMQGREPLRGDVAVELHFYRDSRACCDFDNLAKAVLDAIQHSADAPFGIVILDDVQVVEAHIYKAVDPARPRVEVRVWQLPGGPGQPAMPEFVGANGQISPDVLGGTA